MAKGLVYCGGIWGDPFCIAKLIQAITSAILIIFIMIDVISQLRFRGRFKYGFSQVLQTLMLLTLICNITYSLDHVYDWFYYLESLFYDWYFCTLVFYVTYRILTKSQKDSLTKIKILKVAFFLIMLGFLGIFIYSGLTKVKQCKQIWFLIIDIIGLILCVAMIRIGYQNHRHQVEKMLDYQSDDKVSNPLSRMWILILINVFCQVLQLIQSLVFFIQTDKKCHFVENHVADVIIKLIFSIFSLHLSFACTIIFFYLRRANEHKYLRTIDRSYTLDNRYNFLEMMPTRRDTVGDTVGDTVE